MHVSIQSLFHTLLYLLYIIQKYNNIQLLSAVRRRTMGRKKRDKIEFRFYELPQGESVLGLMGERWVGM